MHLPHRHPTPVSTGDRSAFRPITPQPLSKRTSTGADSVADPAPVLAREGRSNSLSSSISSSISKSLSITLQRPATPQNARASTPQAEDGAAAAREPTPPPVDDGSSEEIKIFNLPPSERVRHTDARVYTYIHMLGSACLGVRHRRAVC